MRDINPSTHDPFRLVDREIWIVTAATHECRGGLVATWVSSASLDSTEPMVMIALAANHFTTELIDQSRSFGLHLISTEQVALAWQFALGSGRDRDKLANLNVVAKNTLAPILADSLAWLDCQVIHRYEAADRIFFWGQVQASGVNSHRPPLREQTLLSSANPEQARELKKSLDLDIEIQRPLIKSWKESLGWS